MSPTSQRILHIAIPSIISNITVPLLGLIDVTIVGHLGSASYIGAIAVGGMLFNMIYWIFGFLRMGTSGLTAQAYGAHDLQEVTRILLRSVGISLMLALALLVLQYPIRLIAFELIDTSDEVQQLLGVLLPHLAYMASRDGSSVCKTHASRCLSPLHRIS